MVGKSKMKDWKASVRTWQRNNKTGSVGKKNSFNDFPQRSYDTSRLEKQLLCGMNDSGHEKEDKGK